MLPTTTLAEQANRHHADAQAKAQEAVQHAIEAGRLLTEAKAQVEHGQWSTWLADNFQGSDRHARRYMKLATKMAELPDSKRTRVANLPSLRQALEAVSEEEDKPSRSNAVLSRPADSRRAYFYDESRGTLDLMAYALLLDKAGKSTEEIAEALAVDLSDVEPMLQPRFVDRTSDNEHAVAMYRYLRDMQLYFWQFMSYRKAANVAVQEGYAEQAAPCRVLADHLEQQFQRLPMPELPEGMKFHTSLSDCAFDDARQAIGLEPIRDTIH